MARGSMNIRQYKILLNCYILLILLTGTIIQVGVLKGC